jgi:hypothetical protein
VAIRRSQSVRLVGRTHETENAIRWLDDKFQCAAATTYACGSDNDYGSNEDSGSNDWDWALNQKALQETRSSPTCREPVQPSS